MLVLTRREREEIIIDGGITVSVLEIKNNRVVLGVKAPESTRIVRAELPLQPQGEA